MIWHLLNSLRNLTLKVIWILHVVWSILIHHIHILWLWLVLHLIVRNLLVVIVISNIYVILHRMLASLVLHLVHLVVIRHHSRLKILHLLLHLLHLVHIAIIASESTSHLVVMETRKTGVHSQFMLTVCKLAFASKFAKPKLLIMTAWPHFIIILIIILLFRNFWHRILDWIVLNFLLLFFNNI